MTCRLCSAPSSAPHGLCGACIADRVVARRRAQGLPALVADAGPYRAIVAVSRPALEGVAA